MSTDLLANAKGLCKEYKATSDGGSSVSALSRVNVQVAAGEMVVLRGPSGCGKTTLLLVLGLLMRPDAGELTFADNIVDYLEIRDSLFFCRTDALLEKIVDPTGWPIFVEASVGDKHNQVYFPAHIHTFENIQ